MFERHGAAGLGSSAKEKAMGNVRLLLAACDGGDSAALALAWVETGLGAVVAAGASALKGMLLLWYELCVFGETKCHDHESKDRARLTAMLTVVCACEWRAVPRADDDDAAEAAVCGAFSAMCGLIAWRLLGDVRPPHLALVVMAGVGGSERRKASLCSFMAIFGV